MASVREPVVGQGGDNRVAVTNDPAIEIDEGRDPTSPRPTTPGVESSNGLRASELEDQSELFLE